LYKTLQTPVVKEPTHF